MTLFADGKKPQATTGIFARTQTSPLQLMRYKS